MQVFHRRPDQQISRQIRHRPINPPQTDCKKRTEFGGKRRIRIGDLAPILALHLPRQRMKKPHRSLSDLWSSGDEPFNKGVSLKEWKGARAEEGQVLLIIGATDQTRYLKCPLRQTGSYPSPLSCVPPPTVRAHRKFLLGNLYFRPRKLKQCLWQMEGFRAAPLLVDHREIRVRTNAQVPVWNFRQWIWVLE